MGCYSFFKLLDADVGHVRMVDFVARLALEGWSITSDGVTFSHLDINAKEGHEWVDSPVAEVAHVLTAQDKRRRFGGVQMNTVENGEMKHAAMVVLDWAKNEFTLLYDDSLPKWSLYPRAMDPVYMLKLAQAFIRAGDLRPAQIRISYDSLL